MSECHCICHTDPENINHCFPCCYQCPNCGRNIETFSSTEHEKECGNLSGYYICKPAKGEECPSRSDQGWMIVHVGKFEKVDEPGVFCTQVDTLGQDFLFDVDEFKDYVGPLNLNELALQLKK